MLTALVEVLEKLSDVDLVIGEQLQCDLALSAKELLTTLKGNLYSGLELERTVAVVLEDPRYLNKLVTALQVSRDQETTVNLLGALKILSADKNGSFNTGLGRTGIFSVLLNFLEKGKSLPPQCRKLGLDLLNLLMKNNVNSHRATRLGLVKPLLKLLPLREQLKNKARFKFCKVVVSCLYHVTKHKRGRHLLSEHEDLGILHALVTELPDSERYDPMLNKIGTIILRCNAPQSLPFIASMESPLKFKIPALKFLPQKDVDESSESSESDVDLEDVAKRKEIQKEAQDFPHQLKWRPLEEILLTYSEFFDESSRFEIPRDQTIIEERLQNLPEVPGETYEALWEETKGILPFCVIPYPDMHLAEGKSEAEILLPKQRRVCRAKLLQTLNHSMFPERYKPKVVFDVEELLRKPTVTKITDEDSIISRGSRRDCLQFESRFESGNLRKALKVGSYEYDLILNPDVNSRNRQSWFYFRVSGMEASRLYTFRVINLEKQRSLFNQGMQPLLFSVRQSLRSGKAEWQRCGQDICYFRNVFRNAASSRGKNFMSLSFCLQFPHDDDVCYVAFHYPYTYTRLLTDVHRWQSSGCDLFRVRTLCHSPSGNPVPVIFFGNIDSRLLPTVQIAVFTARVHPGESNSSFVMQGLVDSMVQAKASSRTQFWNNKLIILVPMLNVDGVINGCGRCEVSNEDLNRRWNEPDPFLHAAVYHTKGLLEYLHRVIGNSPQLLCDLHGHSRKLNVFLYGCSRQSSWFAADHHAPDDAFITQRFCGLIAKQLAAFDTEQCSWQVERYRETTARIFAWRNLHIGHSFTIESSLAGGKMFQKAGCQYSSHDYKQVGSAIYQALLAFWSEED